VINNTGSNDISMTMANVEILLNPISPDKTTSRAPPIILKKPSIDVANPAQYLKGSSAKDVADPDNRLKPAAPNADRAKNRYVASGPIINRPTPPAEITVAPKRTVFRRPNDVINLGAIKLASI
jgi:hypothetical protein